MASIDSINYPTSQPNNHLSLSLDTLKAGQSVSEDNPFPVVMWASFLSFESCELPEESLKTDFRLVSTFTFCQNGKNTAPMPPWYQGIQRQFEFLAVLWALKTCTYFRKSHLSNGLRKLFWWRSYTTGSLEALIRSRALTSSWSHFVVVRFYNPFYSPFPPVLIFRILWAGLERRKCYRRSVMADW